MALAGAVNTPQQNISEFELGKRKPPLDVLIRVADILNCSVDYLVDRAPIPESRLEELAPHEQEVIADLRSQGRNASASDFAASWHDHHVENPESKRSRQTPKK